MKAKTVLVSATVGVGLGTLVPPGAAWAETSVSPTTTPVGGTVVLTTTCNPKSGDAIFHVVGPDRDQNGRSTTTAADGGLSTELSTAGFPLGTYTVAATCGDGSAAGSATFTVTPVGDARAGGHPDGGGAGSVAAGIALLGSAAGGALILARRRRHAALAATR
ncbi:hypothetical protein QTQ03_05475 [Micromonospora sp. WMMA1363]|uniref:hypothetical protein n=1 Tax=Micromonospora sp. WMMA1363 TaxID=3053985 RepID=UPI00259C8281|nr:hypothetical protein [Micromonospora sp. WMMA1363]MDM4719071.1 hypothetical protein [Micromonospora sp. WMMA1363]